MLDAVISVFLHLDQNMSSVVNEYGMWTYLILFLIIFLETGLVVMPFLPGDSLLFVGGAAAASGILSLEWLLVAIIAGAMLGDTRQLLDRQLCGAPCLSRTVPEPREEGVHRPNVRVL